MSSATITSNTPVASRTSQTTTTAATKSAMRAEVYRMNGCDRTGLAAGSTAASVAGSTG